YQNIDVGAFSMKMNDLNIDLLSHEAYVDAEDYLAAFKHVINRSGKEYIGLNFGSFLNLGALGLILEISLNTSSIEQAVLILQNYLKYKFPIVSLKTVESNGSYYLRLESIIEDHSLRSQILDMVIAIMFRELQLMLPEGFEPMISLPHKNRKVFEEILNGKTQYHDQHQLSMPAELLSTEINSARVKEIELLLPKFLSMLNSNVHQNNQFAYQIRNITLNMCSPEIPNFKQVQEQIPYSKRTIQRMLTKEGSSFRSITNTIKKELATYLINEKHLKTKDVAFILGYSDSSAYLHAVKSWNS
ncbi:MAG: AraC family transcriptional regulator ligand-binding domain-containing protein, partial [Balneola sp.]